MTRVQPGVIIYQDAEGARLNVQLTDDVTTLGRSSTCAVSLDITTVSRIHARIELHDEIYILFDNGSANGTFVNGERIDAAYQLQSGDRICLGTQDICLEFADPEETVPVTAAERASALEIIEHMHVVKVYGKPVQLSPVEYKLLCHLAANYRTVCSRESCFQAAWGQSYDDTYADTFNTMVAKLRRRLSEVAEETGQSPPVITTVRGFGLRLETSVTRARDA